MKNYNAVTKSCLDLMAGSLVKNSAILPDLCKAQAENIDRLEEALDRLKNSKGEDITVEEMNAFLARGYQTIASLSCLEKQIESLRTVLSTTLLFLQKQQNEELKTTGENND